MRSQVFGIKLLFKNHVVCSRIDDLISHGGQVALGGLVDAQVVDLHPEIQLLAALEADRSSPVGSHTRTNMSVPNHATACADLSRRNDVHFISQNKRRSGQFFIVIGGYFKAATIQTNVV